MALYSVSGYVKDGSNVPIPYCTITIEIWRRDTNPWTLSGTHVAMTNASGYYTAITHYYLDPQILIYPYSPFGGTFAPANYDAPGGGVVTGKNFVLTGSTYPTTMRMSDTDWMLESARKVQAYYEIAYAYGGNITYMRRYVDATITEHVQEGLFKEAAETVRAAYQSGSVVGDIRRVPAGTYYESKVERQSGFMYRVRRQTIAVGSWYYTGQAFGTQYPNPYEGGGYRTFGIDRIT